MATAVSKKAISKAAKATQLNVRLQPSPQPSLTRSMRRAHYHLHHRHY